MREHGKPDALAFVVAAEKMNHGSPFELPTCYTPQMGKKQMISVERLKELLTYEPSTGVFTWNPVVRKSRAKAYSPAGSLTAYGYIQIKIDQRKLFAHRLAWLFVTGKWPIGEIDHINRNRTDNRFCNLREVSKKQNHENRSRPNGVGVRFEADRQKWLARIKHNQRTINLGRFDSEEEAIAARLRAEVEIFTHSEVCKR